MIDPEVLLQGYRLGVFPMAMEDEEIGWFSPDPRALIPMDHQFHITHGLKRALRKNPFHVTTDSDFTGVIQGCATAHGDTWISDEIVDNYCELHRLGFAHSIEIWQNDELAGGLYGVALGGAFFGESMFHRAANASKIALVALVERLRARNFVLLDTQWTTSHLEQFGTFQVRKSDYLKLLRAALSLDCSF